MLCVSHQTIVKEYCRQFVKNITTEKPKLKGTGMGILCTNVYAVTCIPSPRTQVFQPLITGHQRVIGGHYVVNRDRHDG